ncbi:MAG: hypothetical protein R6V49_04275 [Bacteroidales bacterium]
MKKVILSCCAALFLFACNSGSQAPDQEKHDDASLTKTGKGKYGIESGIVQYKTQMMGMDATQTLYFTDYGKKESTVTTAEMMGMKINSVTITKDGFIYTFDPVKKMGTKTSLSEQPNIDFENLTEEIMVDMKINEAGKETILGKPCIKYSINNESIPMQGFYWVWKGIPMKTNAEMGNSAMVLEATELKDNAKIPDSQFDIPEDIQFM